LFVTVPSTGASGSDGRAHRERVMERTNRRVRYRVSTSIFGESGAIISGNHGCKTSHVTSLQIPNCWAWTVLFKKSAQYQNYLLTVNCPWRQAMVAAPKLTLMKHRSQFSLEGWFFVLCGFLLAGRSVSNRRYFSHRSPNFSCHCRRRPPPDHPIFTALCLCPSWTAGQIPDSLDRAHTWHFLVH